MPGDSHRPSPVEQSTPYQLAGSSAHAPAAAWILVWTSRLLDYLQMKFGVLVFPGSNCDQDTYHVVSDVVGEPVEFLWHESSTLENCDAILVPGGFAYGDYLRTGAIAHFAPIMQAVKKFAASGGLVLGICNGFQILTESGLLPGALMRNAGLKYICKQVYLRTETSDSPFTNLLIEGDVLKIPIGHMEGNYFCDAATLKCLESERPHRLPLRDGDRGSYAGGKPERLAREHCRHSE